MQPDNEELSTTGVEFNSDGFDVMNQMRIQSENDFDADAFFKQRSHPMDKNSLIEIFVSLY